jgi:hypothetical protein
MPVRRVRHFIHVELNCSTKPSANVWLLHAVSGGGPPGSAAGIGRFAPHLRVTDAETATTRWSIAEFDSPLKALLEAQKRSVENYRQALRHTESRRSSQAYERGGSAPRSVRAPEEEQPRTTCRKAPQTDQGRWVRCRSLQVTTRVS